MIRRFKIATVAILATLNLVATPLVSASEIVEPQRTISTTGTGVVTAEPDQANFSIGMEARNEDLKVAQDEVTKESNDITSMLIEKGVAEEDIRTSSYRVAPQNKYDRNGNFVEIEHYLVSTTISVTVNDIELVGELLDESVDLGADSVSNIVFTVSNPDPYIQEARKLAIADAKLKAEDYAAGSDSRLTGLFNLWETSSPQPMAREGDSSAPVMADMEMSEASSEPVQISAGTTTFTVRIETTWTIEPNGMIEPEATPSN